MTERGEVITLEEFFAGRDRVSLELYEAVTAEIELRGNVAPLVVTVDLPRRDKSARWKEIVEPRPGRFTHHLELRSRTQLDDEVRAWLREAWDSAG